MLDDLDTYLDGVLDGLLKDAIQLHQIPTSVASLYYLGESFGRQSMLRKISQTTADRDRYYRAACNGGFSSPLKPHGLNYWQLCEQRGERVRAARVKADMEALSLQIVGGL
jgi:hypothetical protein